MEERISFQNHADETLKGNLHLPSADSEIGVVVGHCFTCSRHIRVLQEICESLTEFGIMALRFDFSGNGQSQGSFAESTHTKQILEMEIASKQLYERGVKWIGLAGHSMGGTIAVLTASHNHWVKAIATVGSRYSVVTVDHLLPAAHKKKLLDEGSITFMSRGRKLTLTTDFFHDAENHQLEEAVSDLKCPLMIVHGDKDEIVPFSEAQVGHEAGGSFSILRKITGADHMFSDARHRQEAARSIGRWFFEQAKNE